MNLSQNLLTELKPEQSYRKAAVIKRYFLQFEVVVLFCFSEKKLKRIFVATENMEGI